MYLNRRQAQIILENAGKLNLSLTKRRWEALKAFVGSEEEWARDFQPTSLKAKAWREFENRLERSYERAQKLLEK